MSKDLTPRPPEELRRILENSKKDLAELDQSPFTSKAFERLRYEVAEYVAQLVTEAVRVAKRHDSESVSTSDVQRASQYLVASSSPKLYRHMGTLGGLVLGTGASNGLSILTTSQFTSIGLLATFFLIVIGSFLIAFHIAKD